MIAMNFLLLGIACLLGSSKTSWANSFHRIPSHGLSNWCTGMTNDATIYPPTPSVCCLKPDYKCDKFIDGYERKYNVLNQNPWSIRRCKCEQKFWSCLNRNMSPADFAEVARLSYNHKCLHKVDCQNKFECSWKFIKKYTRKMIKIENPPDEQRIPEIISLDPHLDALNILSASRVEEETEEPAVIRQVASYNKTTGKWTWASDDDPLITNLKTFFSGPRNEKFISKKP